MSSSGYLIKKQKPFMTRFLYFEKIYINIYSQECQLKIIVICEFKIKFRL